MFKQFIRNETGAITVDWTVLAASTIGLGLSSATVVRVGTSDLGNSIMESLTGASAASLRWAFASTLVSQDFADGTADGWSIARTGVFGAWGPMLGPFGYDTMNTPLTFDVALTDGNTNALIEFDMIIADSWDGVANANNPWTYAGGDTMTLMIDGQAISVEPFVYRTGHPGATPELFETRSSTVEVNGTTYNVTMTMSDAPANVAQNGVSDQRWHVSVEAIDAPSTFTFGMSGSLDQRNLNDESYGVQNFSIVQN